MKQILLFYESLSQIFLLPFRMLSTICFVMDQPIRKRHCEIISQSEALIYSSSGRSVEDLRGSYPREARVGVGVVVVAGVTGD